MTANTELQSRCVTERLHVRNGPVSLVRAYSDSTWISKLLGDKVPPGSVATTTVGVHLDCLSLDMISSR